MEQKPQESNGFYKVGTPLFTYHTSKPVGWNSDFTNNKNQEISYGGTWHLDDGDVPVKNS